MDNATDTKRVAMHDLSGRRILVTGASGVVAFPVAKELAKTNEVYAVARFSDPAQKRMLEDAGAHPIAFDLADHDLSPLPESVDVVINYAVLPPQKNAYEVNAGAAGRLARRYRDCEAFVHGSTGSLYEYQGERPAARGRSLRPAQLGRELCGEQDRGGISAQTSQRGLPAAGDDGADLLLLRPARRRSHATHRPDRSGIEPVSVYPGVRNVHTPLYEDDYVEKTIAAAGIAKVGAEIVNVGGTEAVTTQEYCEMAGEILGKKPIFVENSKAWPIWADTTKMVKLLGPNKISVREGVRRMIEAARSDAYHRITSSANRIQADDYFHRPLASAAGERAGLRGADDPCAQ